MMFWEFQQLEIHFPRASLQLGFSRVSNRSWATVFGPRIGGRSSGCWLAQFMCDTCAQANCEIERLSRYRPRKNAAVIDNRIGPVIPLVWWLSTCSLSVQTSKTLSANTSPLALTDQTPQHFPHTCLDSTALTNRTAQHSPQTCPDSTAHSSRRHSKYTCTHVALKHLRTASSHLCIYIFAHICVYISASSRLCICTIAFSRLSIYAPMHLRLTVYPSHSDGPLRRRSLSIATPCLQVLCGTCRVIGRMTQQRRGTIPTTRRSRKESAYLQNRRATCSSNSC